MPLVENAPLCETAGIERLLLHEALASMTLPLDAPLHETAGTGLQLLSRCHVWH